MILALASLAAAQAPAGIEHREENELLQFSYSWSAGLETRAAARGLRAAMLAHMARRRAGMIRDAGRDRRYARAQGIPFNRHLLAYEWVQEGAGVQLDSLSMAVTIYTGGGHAEESDEVLLWDSTARRTIALAAILGPAAMASLARRACAAQVAQLRERHVLPPEDDEASACDRLGGRAFAPSDTNGDGRFETIRVLAWSSRYDIGRYAVELPIEAEDLARVPDGLRPAFEIWGERRVPIENQPE